MLALVTPIVSPMCSGVDGFGIRTEFARDLVVYFIVLALLNVSTVASLSLEVVLSRRQVAWESFPALFFGCLNYLHLIVFFFKGLLGLLFEIFI